MRKRNITTSISDGGVVSLLVEQGGTGYDPNSPPTITIDALLLLDFRSIKIIFLYFPPFFHIGLFLLIFYQLHYLLIYQVHIMHSVHYLTLTFLIHIIVMSMDNDVEQLYLNK